MKLLIFCFILMTIIWYFAWRWFKPIKINNTYDCIKESNNTEDDTKIFISMPRNKQLDTLLQFIIDNNDDNFVFNALSKNYEQNIDSEYGLDVIILTLSDLLYERATTIKDKNESRGMYRAAKITKRLAHTLYRKYKNKYPTYSNSKFLQFVS
jgi:hypothetical protein